MWSFWQHFGYLVIWKTFSLYEISDLWSFRLYGQFYQDKTVVHISGTECILLLFPDLGKNNELCINILALTPLPWGYRLREYTELCSFYLPTLVSREFFFHYTTLERVVAGRWHLHKTRRSPAAFLPQCTKHRAQNLCVA